LNTGYTFLRLTSSQNRTGLWHIPAIYSMTWCETRIKLLRIGRTYGYCDRRLDIRLAEFIWHGLHAGASEFSSYFLDSRRKNRSLIADCINCRVARQANRNPQKWANSPPWIFERYSLRQAEDFVWTPCFIVESGRASPLTLKVDVAVADPEGLAGGRDREEVRLLRKSATVGW